MSQAALLDRAPESLRTAQEFGGHPCPVQPWRVIHTRSRQEKALAEYLQSRAIDHYLPLVARVRYYGRRKFRVVTPLFPGYLFLRGGPEVAYVADRTARVVRILQVFDQDGLESDLAALRFALERNAGLDPAPGPVAGTRVEVVGGPFRGLHGFVERGGPDDRLLLRVRALGRAAELEIDRSLLRPVD